MFRDENRQARLHLRGGRDFRDAPYGGPEIPIAGIPNLGSAAMAHGELPETQRRNSHGGLRSALPRRHRYRKDAKGNGATAEVSTGSDLIPAKELGN